LKFQAVAEKTAKDARGLLYFAAPGRSGGKLLTYLLVTTLRLSANLW